MKKLIIISCLILQVFSVMAADPTFTKVHDAEHTMVTTFDSYEEGTTHYFELYRCNEDKNWFVAWIDHIQRSPSYWSEVIKHTDYANNIY